MGLRAARVVTLVAGLAAAAGCGPSNKGAASTTPGASLLGKSAALPRLNRNIAWMAAARSYGAVDRWLGLDSAAGAPSALSNLVTRAGLTSLGVQALSGIGIDPARPAGLVGLDSEHGTWAVFLSVADGKRVAAHVTNTLAGAKVAVRESMVGNTRLWVPKGDLSYGVVLRERHVFVVVTEGPRSVRNRAIVSLTSVERADALTGDATFARAARALRAGRDLVFYLPPRPPTRRAGVRALLSNALGPIAVGASLNPGGAKVDAWAGSPPSAQLGLSAARASDTIVFGSPTTAVPFTAAGKMAPSAVLALLDAWWQSQGAPPIGRVYEKLVGGSFLGDWKPILSGNITVAVTSATAGGKTTSHTHIAIGVNNIEAARKRLAHMAARVPIISKVGDNFSLRTDQNRRVPIVVRHGAVIITSAGQAPPTTTAATPSAGPPSVHSAVTGANAAAFIAADVAQLAALLLPNDNARTRRMLPVAGPGAPLSDPYKALIAELRQTYAALARAETQLAMHRRATRAATFGALGRLSMVITPASDAIDATGSLALPGASRALIHVASTASANAQPRLIRLQNLVSTLTQRADSLRNRARLRRQRDVADHLLRKRLSTPPVNDAPNK